MRIVELNLSEEDVNRVEEFFSIHGVKYESRNKMLNEEDFHYEDSAESMFNWIYDEKNHVAVFTENYFNKDIQTVIESGCKTLGEFFLCDDCISVTSDDKELWLYFYV